MADFTMQKGDDGVAIITWDVPGKSMNVMRADALLELSDCIDDALADDAVKGIVITSGKPDSFAGGMDLTVLAEMRDSFGDDPAREVQDRGGPLVHTGHAQMGRARHLVGIGKGLPRRSTSDEPRH